MNLKEFIEKQENARRDGFIKFKNLKEQGQKIVGTYCTYTPKEVITAAGALPVSLCGTKEEPIKAAERDLPRNLCPLIKSSYGYGITDTCPYFYFSDLLVGETTCDGKKKMYELLGSIKPMHVMNLPQTNIGKDAFSLWRNEIIKLIDRLEREFNVKITSNKLQEAIKTHNNEKRVLQNFMELSKLSPPPLTGTDMNNVLSGFNFSDNIEETLAEISKVTNQILSNYKTNGSPVSKDAPRILITGCPMGGVHDKVTKTIEEAGGVVVCFENCGGAKNLYLMVDEEKEPIDAIAERYLKICCSVMTPNNERLSLLSELIDEFKVDGVIEVVLMACHTYNVESAQIKRFVNGEKSIPYSMLETDYSQNDKGQIKTRVEAFIEMLEQ